MDVAEKVDTRLLCLEKYLQNMFSESCEHSNDGHHRNNLSFSENLFNDSKNSLKELTAVKDNSADTSKSSIPVQIVSSEKHGRYLVAKRDILKGEVIFWEKPYVIAPKMGVGPTCLRCLKSLPKHSWPRCERCGAPCCDNCNGDEHSTEECRCLEKMELKNSGNLPRIQQLNTLLTPLRTWLLIKSSRNSGELIEALQSNTEHRITSALGQFITENIVRPMIETLQLDIHSGLIHHICGVFDTNAFDVSFSDTMHGRALLPLCSLMNHSCSPNTQHWFVGGRCVVRASRLIPKGDPITNTYTQTLWGNTLRQRHLALTKYFLCTCSRCSDPSEWGTNLSSLACPYCDQTGKLLPPGGRAKMPWTCSTCGKQTDGSVVEGALLAASKLIKAAQDLELTSLGKLCHHLQRKLGRTHHYVLSIEINFLKAVLKNREGASDEEVSFAFDVADRALRVADVLEPGFSRLRGILILLKLQCLQEICRRTSGASESCSLKTEPVLKCMKGMIPQFEECKEILKFDSCLPELLELKEFVFLQETAHERLC